MADIEIGLIGYGSWTRTAFLPALERDGRAVIVSAAARSQESRDRAVSELGPTVRTFASAEDLLSGPAVHAVMIAVPDEVHEDALCAALESGVSVFYEPPLADTRQRLRPMIRRLQAATQLTQADLELGFAAVVRRVCDLSLNGTIGRIQSARIFLLSDWGPIPDSDLCTIDHLAPWYVDVLSRIIGRRPRRVMVLDGQGVPGRRQNHSIGQFDYGGAWGVFQVSIGGVGGVETTIEVRGDDGDIIADVFSGEVRHRTRDRPDWTIEQARGIEPYAGWPGMHECVAAFLDAVESAGPSPVDSEVASHLHLVGLAAETAIDAGGWVEVEEI